METIVDHLDTVNSNSFLKEIENPEKIKSLILKNFNNDTNWEELNKFTQLKEIQLENCLIDNNIFFKAISKIQSLNIFKYDYDCVIKKSDTKINIKIPQLNKIVFTFADGDSPNLSMLDLYDRQYSINNFITAFPNYPNAYQGLSEIELINYDIFLNNLKQQDFDYGYSEIYEGKDIFFQCDIYNLLRLKKLKNINFCKTNEDLNEKKIIIEKIFAFPGTSKITINNQKIQSIKDSVVKAKTLFLDFKTLPNEEKNITSVNKHSSIRDALHVHWPSQYYNGYSKLFNEIIKSKIDNVIISPVEDFFNDFFEYYEGSVDFIRDELTKNKSIKKITFEFYEKENSSWSYDDRSYYRQFFYLVRELIKKKIKIEIDFKDIRSEEDLDERFEKYIEFFNFYLNCLNSNNHKNYFEIINIKSSNIDKYVKNLFFEKIKTIIVIDDQSNSKTLKKFKDIELINAYLDDFYGFDTFEQDIDFSNFKSTKSEESFLDFFEYDFFAFWTIKHFEENPGGCIPIVRKSFLDNSKQIIFNNLNNIFFKYIGDIPYDNYEKVFLNKTFQFPKSINYQKIKDFSINENPPLALCELGFMKNLETLNFRNYVNQKMINCWDFPVFNNLSKININILYPFMDDNESSEENLKKVNNIEKSKNLEEVVLSIGETVNYDETRWNTIDVDLTGFYNLRNLRKLEINSIDQTLIKNLKNLDNLEELEISNPFMITQEKKSDEGTIHLPLTENDFDFVKYSKKLKKLTILFPRSGFYNERINLNIEKFLDLINVDLEEIRIMCAFEKKELNLASIFYEGILNKFSNIKKIDLDISCIDAKKNKYEYSSKKDSAYQKEIQRRERSAKYPVKIDFKNFLTLKKIHTLDLEFDENIGTRLENIDEILNHSKLKNINIDEEKFDTKDLEKIFEKTATKKDKYILNYNKKNEGEAIYYSHKMDEKSSKEYNEIQDENNEDENIFEISNSSILNILVKRYKELKNSK